MFDENGGPSATKPTVVSMKIVPEIVVPAPIPLNFPETSKATRFALATPTPRARAHAVASATLRFDFIVAILRGGHQRHLVDMQCQVRSHHFLDAPDVSIRAQAATIKARWICEQA